jgi:hypothetical protein
MVFDFIEMPFFERNSLWGPPRDRRARAGWLRRFNDPNIVSSRFLVALPPVWDLLLRAKDLFIAATPAGSRLANF